MSELAECEDGGVGMFGRKRRTDLIRELSGLSLGNWETAFIYLGYSGIIARTASETLAFDVADLLRGEEIKALGSLDLLLFTHSHGDHYSSREAVEIFEATGAHVMAEPLVANDLKDKIPSDKLTGAIPGEVYTIGDFEIGIVRGVHRGPINLYQVKRGEISIFHGGDSGYVPLKDYQADLAFLPTGTPSPTASPEHAFRMALELKPRVAVAIHGSTSQSKQFQRKVMQGMPETTTIIPEPYSLRRASLKKKA